MLKMKKLLTFTLSILLLSVAGCVNESNPEPKAESGGAESLLLNDFRYGYHWPLHGLDLPDKVLEKIYRLNARKIAGLGKS
jgi:hypothetical protein